MNTTCVLTVLLLVAGIRAESPIACNLKALTPAQRARLSTLSHKLNAAARDHRELPDGISFRLDTAAFSLSELGEWIEDERRCCPFLDFRLVLPRESGELQVSLTGRPGVKEFLLTDFASLRQATIER